MNSGLPSVFGVDRRDAKSAGKRWPGNSSVRYWAMSRFAQKLERDLAAHAACLQVWLDPQERMFRKQHVRRAIGRRR